jgi:hypothetical protein
MDLHRRILRVTGIGERLRPEAQQHTHSDTGEKEWVIGRKVVNDSFRRNHRVLQVIRDHRGTR